MKESFNLKRQGTFTTEVHGSYHCGTQSPLEIHYRVEIECEGLDSRGFLFDQLDIVKYFSSIKRTSLSCEKLGRKALEDIKIEIKRENPSLKIFHLSVTLSPAPFEAEVTCEWPEATLTAGN